MAIKGVSRRGRPPANAMAKRCGCKDRSIKELLEMYTPDGCYSVRHKCSKCGREFESRVKPNRATGRYVRLCKSCAGSKVRCRTGVGVHDFGAAWLAMTRDQRVAAMKFSPFRDGPDPLPRYKVAPHEFVVASVRKAYHPEYGVVTVTSRR